MHIRQRLIPWMGIVCVVSAVCTTTPAAGQTNKAPSQREKNKAIVQKVFDSNTSEFGTNTSMLVRPGLLASRTEKWVQIQAEAVGIRSDYNCEFMLIAETSGHDYESLLVSFAKPSDIHEGLVFIGMKPGRPADPAKYRFWPRGERVFATAEWDNGTHFRARGEALLVNTEMGTHLPKDGFVFVGSAMRNPPNNPTGTPVYAADAFEPNCIVSYYNDFETVLDVPRVAAKGAVYNVQYPNAAYPFATGQMVSVTFETEYKDGRIRVLDLVLKVSPPAQGVEVTFSNLVFLLVDSGGTNLVSGGRFQDAIAVFEQAFKNGCDPFVRVEFDGDLPLSAIRNVSRILKSIDNPKGIRIDAPLAGHAYFQAFIPNAKFRDPAKRSTQPWEFRISNSNGKTDGTLTLVEDRLNRQTEKWSTVTNTFEASSPDAVRKIFETRTDDSSQRIGPLYVFMFAPGSMSYKTIAPFIAACLETRPYLHIYLE